MNGKYRYLSILIDNWPCSIDTLLYQYFPSLSCGDHDEGSSIVMDIENLNCPRSSPMGNELNPILKMVSQTLIFLNPVKKIEEIHGPFLKFHTLEMLQFL